MIIKSVKILGIIFVLLLTGAFAGVETVTQEKEKKEINSIEINFEFQKEDFEMEKVGEYVRIESKEEMNYIMKEGYPMLPYKVKVIKFPAGTKIEKVEIKEIKIGKRMEGKVLPTPPVKAESFERIEGEIYAQNEAYPPQWISYHTGVGIDEGNRVLYVVLQIHPFRYIPKNEIEYLSSISIEIKYTPPEKPLLTKDDYDLLIICPNKYKYGIKWYEELLPLVEHKEKYGIKTKLVTLDQVTNGVYFPVEGRDDAEKLKYFIKDAIEQWGIKYVMLVGGRQGGVKEERWLMPVRYSYLDDGGEKKFISDLYFADIYKYEDGNIVFEDWDSNGNGIYGEWHMGGRDILDLYPDVYVGRLACRNKWEVNIMVNKIINYETTAYGKEWTKRFIGVAGDTYPSEDDPFYEGEVATKAAFDLLDDCESVFLWTSTGTLSSANDIINAISQGACFVHFSGHGNPMSWATHPPHDEETWIGIDVFQFYKFSNNGMYPITIIGGCHNNQFNVSLFNLLKIKHLKEIYYKSEWGPECYGWWLARKIGGGGIATIANTGYGYGIPGEDCLKGRGRYMEINFFKSIAEGKDMLGEAHASDLAYYLNAFPPMTDRIDTKIVEQWALLGDPSLKIGGYPS